MTSIPFFHNLLNKEIKTIHSSNGNAIQSFCKHKDIFASFYAFYNFDRTIKFLLQS